MRLTATVSITTAVEDGERWPISSIIRSRRYSAQSSIWRKLLMAGDRCWGCKCDEKNAQKTACCSGSPCEAATGATSGFNAHDAHCCCARAVYLQYVPQEHTQEGQRFGLRSSREACLLEVLFSGMIAAVSRMLCDNRVARELLSTGAKLEASKRYERTSTRHKACQKCFSVVLVEEVHVYCCAM